MRLLIYLLAISFSFFVFCQLRPADKARIKVTKRISELYGESVWKGYNKTPFSILYVMDDYEYLIGHPNPPEGFELLGHDSQLGADVHHRSTQMNKGFLATFPFAGINTVVIGTPENTGLNSTEWIITLLHERFHQYQYSSPGYFQDVNALDLANGDESGMWQLNYPFPYKEMEVIEKYEAYTRALHNCVRLIDTEEWEQARQAFVEARKQFKAALQENDYKYMSFQWYQEGIARYTEYAFLEKLTEFDVAPEVAELTDFVPFADYRETFFDKHINNVLLLKLEEVGRITVYDVGFAEALILRELNPGWKDKYLDIKFDLEKLY